MRIDYWMFATCAYLGFSLSIWAEIPEPNKYLKFVAILAPTIVFAALSGGK